MNLNGLKYNEKGYNLFQEDWDNLIILDACRFDVFKDNNILKGNLKAIESVGPCTPQWIKGTFINNLDKCSDIVYYAGCPYAADRFFKKLLGKNPFHKVYELFINLWHPIYKTVLPQDMNRVVVNTSDQFKNKKKIIHYIQPHHPFISKPEWILESWSGKRNEALGGDYKHEKCVWTLLKERKISKEDAWEAYVENFKIVIKEVELLLPYLKGKTIITADHGNGFMEKWNGMNILAHPNGVFAPILLNVPYFEVDMNEYKSIDLKKSEEDMIQDRLKSLGYI